MWRFTVAGLGMSLLMHAANPAAVAARLDGVYCSLDPSYRFRMNAEKFVDSTGECRVISSELDPAEGSLVIKHDCPGGVRSVTVANMHGSAIVAFFEDGNQYKLARCSAVQ